MPSDQILRLFSQDTGQLEPSNQRPVASLSRPHVSDPKSITNCCVTSSAYYNLSSSGASPPPLKAGVRTKGEDIWGSGLPAANLQALHAYQ